MPRYAWNKSAPETKAQYYELIRKGMNGSQASKIVGVSLSCGSNWFVDAGSVTFIDKPISKRFFDQDDRIEIAEGLDRGESAKVIAARIGKNLSKRLPGDRSQQPGGWFVSSLVRPWPGIQEASTEPTGPFRDGP